MLIRSSLLALALSVTACVASAETGVSATFLGTTVYATAAECAKQKRIVAGGPRSLATVPETLSATGYTSFEGGCRFENIVERYQGRIWTVSMRCSEGAIENQPRTEVWRRLPDGSLLVTADKRVVTYVACTEAAKAPAKKK